MIICLVRELNNPVLSGTTYYYKLKKIKLHQTNVRKMLQFFHLIWSTNRGISALLAYYLSYKVQKRKLENLIFGSVVVYCINIVLM